MMIVLLGPDGSGKSSLIQGIRERLKPVFREMYFFHLRFPLLPNRSEKSTSVTEPHAQVEYSPLKSICKILYFIVRYQVGYWLHYRLIRSPNILIAFDRYYHDLMVDPKRFRYGAPLWLAEKAFALIPKPHAVILLDAPAEVLQARKQEVPFAETERQRFTYLKLVESIPTGYVVDAALPLEQVIERVEMIVRTVCGKPNQ